MNGTANGYNHEISSPGWGFGSATALEPDQMGIAQLSNRLLVPPDGLTFREGTCGEIFGYAWLVLPLTEPKATTAGLPVPTGNQSWTLFINSGNFKGPVAFHGTGLPTSLRSGDADLSEAEKERLQAIVEKIHAQWTLDREYLQPSRMGTLATLDGAGPVVSGKAGLLAGRRKMTRFRQDFF